MTSSIGSLSLYNAKGNRAGRQIGTPGLLGFCHYAFSTVAPKDVVDDFLRKLMTGENLDRDDPILRTRERLLFQPKFYSENKVELIFRTWNASMREIKMDRSPGLFGDKLPKLEGPKGERSAFKLAA
jgi:hypothetical protein